MIVHDDATEDHFTTDGIGGYNTPPGIFATLTADAAPGTGYTLLSKSQWIVHYLADGKLDYVQDPSGNQVTCTYIDIPGPAYGKLYKVTDAAGRWLDLEYNTYGELKGILDPIGRRWALLYEDIIGGGAPIKEGDGFFVQLNDAMATPFSISWTYTTLAEIATIADKNGDAYAYSYTGGRLTQVTDPAPFTSQTRLFYYQEPTPGVQQTTHVDRRGSDWKYQFDMSLGNLTAAIDPLSHSNSWTYTPYGTDPDLIHERISSTNALNKTWSIGYDTSGNVLTVTDPLSQRTAYTYDALNNVTTMTPPGPTPLSGNVDKRVTYVYGDTNHPTSVTAVQEPPAQVGGTVPVTTVVYYGPLDATPFGTGTWNGLVKVVTPPYEATPGNPVVTELTYDANGHLATESEGPPTEPDLTPLPVINSQTNNNVGSPTSLSNQITCGDLSYDANGNVTGSGCCHVDGGGSFPGTWPPIASCTLSVVPPPLEGSFYADAYTGMGQPTNLYSTISDNTPGRSETSLRDKSVVFDELGRLTQLITSTTEAASSAGVSFDRDFTLSEDWTLGEYSLTGPDQEQPSTTVSTDTVGRAISLTRGVITATATYYADDSVDIVTNGNNSRTKNTYDDAGRSLTIRHETISGVRLHELAYLWSTDGLVDAITETDALGNISTTSFTYDNRNRLTAEARVGQHRYSLTYAYDIAGNRTVKVDVLNDLTTTYTYDVSDPSLYGSQGNRLMAEATSDNGFTVEERWYTYDIIGNVDMVIRRIAGDLDPLGKQWYRGTRLYYAKNGRLWISRSERWRLNRNELAANCEPLAAMEYRYDGARARYMVRPRDPDTMLPYSDDDGDWFDYAGNSIYNDYTVDYDGQTTVTATNAMSHVPGLAQFDLLTGDLHHLHGNLIGTTEIMTDDPISGIPTVANRTVTTAFGEPVYEAGTVGTRYGYAGAWGYQSPASADPLSELGWLHVGARYYDPSCGRFVQRDPIGIRGGLNVYGYVENTPTILVDPSGHGSWWDKVKGAAKAVWDVASCLPGYVLPSSPVPAQLAPDVGYSYTTPNPII